MSFEKLDRILDELVAVAQDRDDLREWIMQPLDEGMLDLMQLQVAQGHFPGELMHMARRVSFLPGLYGWSKWDELEDHPKLPAPNPGQLAWERTVREIFQEDQPGREPTVRWAMIGSDPDLQYDCVVPLLPEPWDHAPICFSNNLDSVSVVSPSLTAFLESFLVYLNAVTEVFGEKAVEFPDFDLYFDFYWWTSIHELYADHPDLKAAITEPLARINAADQNDHPMWRHGGPVGVMFNDSRLLWP